MAPFRKWDRSPTGQWTLTLPSLQLPPILLLLLLSHLSASGQARVGAKTRQQICRGCVSPSARPTFGTLFRRLSLWLCSFLFPIAFQLTRRPRSDRNRGGVGEQTRKSATQRAEKVNLLERRLGVVLLGAGVDCGRRRRGQGRRDRTEFRGRLVAVVA